MPDSILPNNKPSATDPASGAAGSETPVFGMHDFHAGRKASMQQTRILWGIFALLLVLVAGVIFILPRYVSPPDPATLVTRPVVQPAPQQPAASPFSEAQLMRQRAAAQETLQALLESQEALEEISVEAWAGVDFARALDMARQGDDAYAEQSFQEAQTLYQAGLDALQELQTRSSTVLEESLATGQQAIIDGEPELALQSFETALLIDSANQEADAGYARAQVLDDVLALLETGSELHENRQFEAAREQYQQALAIDAEHVGANAALEQVNADIENRDFLGHMSRGYASLQSGMPEAALEAFNEALALRSGSTEAATAIEQAQSQITNRQLNVHLTAASEFRNDERWAEAVEAYDKALAIDANVVAAVEGRRYSQNRRDLDTYLRNLLSNPLRLSESQVYDEAVRVYNNAINVEAPNARLTEQLREVLSYLQAATVPKPVSFQSDGLTNVTVLRVSQLGLFNDRTLELTPGNYVAVGVREGYRDTRKEFTVPFHEEPPIVTIMCEDQIR